LMEVDLPSLRGSLSELNGQMDRRTDGKGE
jgi:hypothetical protein